MATGPMEWFDIRDRVAIVTGGSRGIGLAVARGFAQVGARVVVASRKADACDAAAAAIRAEGGTAVGVPTHVGDLGDLQALVARTVDEFGGVDIVVNNAANPLAQRLGEVTPEAFAKSYDVNVRAPLFLVQYALPHLRESDAASVINVISAGVFTHGTYVALYVSAKSALLALTKSMAAEFAPWDVRVNALAPGTTATHMVFALPEDRQQAMVQPQLIKRMADPEELVPGALFLASRASQFMTGQTLTIDGGLTTH